jgi:glyoxylase-like metal-dependent hydrolase (beta-lactamase superfamily II)
VVIDTPWDDALTATLLDWVERELGGVKAVIVTHFHSDRMGGIAEVHRRGIVSYGHTATARLAVENDLPPPRNLFVDELALSTGSHPVELSFPGAGHTADNVVVWLPDQGVLFGGCLLKANRWTGLGFIGDAVVESWAASLDKLLDRYPNAGIVVPGHGEPGGLEIVRHTRDLVLQHLARAASDPKADRQRGVSWVAQPYEVVAADVDALIDAKVDWIVQTPFGWQTGIDTPEIELHTDGRIYWGERDAGLEETTRLARDRGIKTLLKPHLWIRRAEGKWRSDVAMNSEADWQRWFASYHAFILHYARLAERLGIEALCIGTELRRTVVERPDDWRRLIAEIRTVYAGELTYAANWYLEFQEVPFWDDLDYIGIQAYFPLSAEERPSLAALERGWQEHLPAIEEVQRRFDRPVLFTEIGYKSTPGTAAEPWTWPDRDAQLPVDLELQADAYRAFFEVFWHRPWLAGVYFWKWYPRAPPPDNADFTPQGKPAERVMSGWYGGA